MRKMAIILLFTSIFILSLNAEESILLSNKVEINVKLDEADEFIEIGFTDSPISSRSVKPTINRLEYLRLEYEERPEGNILSKKVFAYWNVVSPNEFKILLSASPLVNENGGNLDFTVTWIPFRNEEVVCLGEEGNFEALEIYTHSPDLSLSHTGSLEISIETDVLESALPGVYHCELIMFVESE